ncbi:hypothetical protein BGZ83_005080 [Gryganskiella cystojenkinii]|nr:hypothetical protein BGZ83_005080 [Gryganskiella cystojenkinii]
MAIPHRPDMEIFMNEMLISRNQNSNATERVYRFLLECCLLILHDIPRETLGRPSDKSPIEPAPPALTLVEPGVNSLTALSTMAPYRLPANLDLRRLQDLVAAKRSAVEDHIWSLREDPGYFADTLAVELDHRVESLKDMHGRSHELMRPNRRRELYERVSESVVSDAHSDLVSWNDLHERIDAALTLQRKYKADLDSGMLPVLPPDLELVFLDLYYCLENNVKNSCTLLERILRSSPPLKDCFFQAPAKPGSKGSLRVIENKLSPTWDLSRRQLMVFLELLWDDRERAAITPSGILDSLDHVFQLEGGQGWDLLSARVSGVVEDISLLAECHRQIELYQPWATRFRTEACYRDTELNHRLQKRTQVLNRLKDARPLFSWPESDPTSGRFLYPVDKRRNQETTKAMQLAEKNLDQFWTAIDKGLVSKVDPYRQAPFTRILDRRTLSRTSDWVPPEPKKRKSAVQKKEADGIIQPLSQLQLDSERTHEVEFGIKAPSTKTKVKSRGVGSPAAANSSVDDPSSESPDDLSIHAGPTIAVDKRSFKVFGTLFYQPTASAQPGEIPWNDFLHAMTNVGFAVEKLYGSVWHFSPSLDSNKFMAMDRSIQFHEPHPIAKIPYRIGRRFGRRLFRAYGWRGETFKLEGSDS